MTKAGYTMLYWWSLLLVATSFSLHAQKGTEFWFAAPEISSHSDLGDSPVELVLFAYDNPATNVVISQPALNWDTTVNIGAHDMVIVDLTYRKNNIENQPGNTVLDYGLRITSEEEISGYYEIGATDNPDIFTLKAEHALGIEFIIPAQNRWNNAGVRPLPISSFNIVATEDNTTVTIIPREDVVGHAAGVPYTVTLDRGQTYAAQAGGRFAADHLGGSEVTSDKPIAITICDDAMDYNGSNTGACSDLGGDQLVPVTKTGKEFVVVKGDLSGPDYIYVAAIYDNTDVIVDGVNMATIDRGEQYEHALSNTNAFIQTSEPVYVLQLTGRGCQLAMAIVPSLACSGSKRVNFSRSTSEQFNLFLIASDDNVMKIRKPDDASATQKSKFNPVNNPGDYWNYFNEEFDADGKGNKGIPVDEAGGIEAIDGVVHVAILNGATGTGCRFGFFSGFDAVNTGAIYKLQITN